MEEPGRRGGEGAKEGGCVAEDGQITKKAAENEPPHRCKNHSKYIYLLSIFSSQPRKFSTLENCSWRNLFKKRTNYPSVPYKHIRQIHFFFFFFLLMVRRESKVPCALNSSGRQKKSSKYQQFGGDFRRRMGEEWKIWKKRRSGRRRNFYQKEREKNSGFFSFK